jgi:regulatory protein
MNLKQKQISEKLINMCFDEIMKRLYKTITRIYEDYYSKQKGLAGISKKNKNHKIFDEQRF